ncbi:SH3 domain-containing protein [Leptospira sp. WS39.C2]
MKFKTVLFFLLIGSNLFAERLYYYVNAKSVRLRETPSLDSKVLTILKENETVDSLGEKSQSKVTVQIGKKDINDYFYFVKTSDDMNGWVFGQYLTDSITFEKDIVFCSRAIPTETVLGLDKKSFFDKKELRYTEEFQIKGTKFLITNGGCDYFTHVIRIEEQSKLQLSDHNELLKLIRERLELLSKYYQNDFDLKLVISHLQKKKIQFDSQYEFLSGKKINGDVEDNQGPSFQLKKPIFKNQKISFQIILASGLL